MASHLTEAAAGTGASPVPAADGVRPREALEDPLVAGQGDGLSVVGDRHLGALPRATQADPRPAGDMLAGRAISAKDWTVSTSL
jgi:hypothetical protein